MLYFQPKNDTMKTIKLFTFYPLTLPRDCPGYSLRTYLKNLNTIVKLHLDLYYDDASALIY